MTVRDFLASLRRKNVRLRADGENLRFKAPKGALTADDMEELRRRKAEILAQLSGAVRDDAPIVPVPRDGSLPLSFAQQRLWLVDQIGVGAAYNVPWAVWLEGELDIAAFERSINAIVERHEVLRTRLPAADGKPVQEILPALEIPLPLVDVREMDEAAQQREVERCHEAERQTPFDLSRGPLVRPTLLCLGDRSYLLFLTLHHIVSDGWSMGLLIRELVAHYQAFTTGARVDLPELPVQYADFACWQRQMMQGEALERQLSYWRDRLAGLTALSLPTDRPRPPMQAFRGSSRPISIPAELLESLQALSRSEDVTITMTLLTAFQVLLARYSGQDDVVVGSPIANRNRQEIENLIGFFVNNLVLRTDLAGDPTFLEAVRRVRETSLGAYEHQDLPFERLVDELAPDRDPSRSPLFQVVFSMQNAPTESPRLSGLAIRPFEYTARSALFDLQLSLSELSVGIRGEFLYNTDLFDDATIERMADHFRTLLEGIVEAPATRLSRLPLLNDTERRQVLSVGADEATSYPTDLRVHELFEVQAASRPQATALTYEDQCLTYAELNARANRVAHYLRARGVGPEVLVGVCIERSLDLVIAVLGVLKAGGAYVPLDTGYPKQRLSFILGDSRMQVLLTQSHLTGDLPEDCGEVVCLEASATDIDRQPETNPAPVGTPGDTAYVIYTSGSTGTPKGVPVQHDTVTRLFAATEAWYGFDERDVWTLFHSCAFDFSVWEIWGALLYGGRLVVVPYETSRSPEEFHGLVRREGVTVLNQTPSAFRQFINADQMAEGSDELALRYVIFGGEALELESLRPWFERHGDERPQLVNMYGITETTVHVTYRPLGMADLSQAPGSVIGRPIPDLRVLVLDAHGQPCPIGVPGELHVGGAGVTRGYLGRPVLTAERFVPDPFHAEPGGRLYRTGDVARLLANGDLEYLGRNDEQVKVRGFRIELGEIEAVLLRHDGVREAVAMVREDDPGTKRIVAYVVTDDDDGATVSELRACTAEQLPQYMVPAAFVSIESVPLTAHGKVDRRELPAPTGERAASDDGYVAPRTDAESALAAIWADLLRIERVGVHDNFFELGGDSILSIQIIARARQEGLYLTPRQMFQHQTVAELAAVVETTAQPSVAAEQGPVVGDVVLAPIQRWFFEQERIDAHHYNQAVLFTVRERLDPAVVEQAVDALFVHHDALRSRFKRSTSGWRQRIVEAGGESPFERVDLSSLGADEQRAAIVARAAELQASLVLDEGPLVRVAQFDLGQERPGRLLIVIHHLVVDAVSWRILREDLQRACEQLGRGESVQLPPKTTSYRQWASRMASHAESDEVRAELDWWLDQRWDDVGELPTEGPASANVGGQARSVSVTLSEAETRALLREVPRAYNTQIDDVLLTALAQSLAAWTGRPRLLVDMEGHGREDLFDDVDLTRTVGWFTSICPVLVDIGDSDGQPLAAGDALKSVKEQLRSVPNRGIGYGMLRYLGGDDRLRALPRPKVSFNYFGQLDQRAEEQPLFDLSSESVGEFHSPRDLRTHLLDVSGAVRGGQLTMGFMYGSEVHDAQTIETVAERYRTALLALIEHCTASGTRGYTPSDFPLADVDQEALDRLVAKHGADAIEDLYALSPMQRGMLFHSAHEPTTGVYIEQLHFDIEELEADTFERSWEQVIDRHPVLRTSIVGARTDTPVQLVHRTAPLRVSRHDCRDLDGAAYDAWVDQYLREDRLRGFDLSEPGLTRLAIVRFGGERHQFIWTFHHIILDGWSFPRVLNEVLTIYLALRGGRQADLPAVAPYREYIGWLRRQDDAKTREYWKHTLAGFETPTIVTPSSSRVGPRERVSQYDAEWTSVAPGVTKALQSLARGYQLTLNTLVVGAWGLLLSRYSGEDDVVFGTIVSGRPPELPGIESAIGMFVNVLPLRIRVRPDETLGQWLARLQHQQAELRQYEHSPLWETQRASEVPAGSPLFQCIFAFENFPDVVSTGEPGRPALRILRTIERTGYPLTFTISPQLSMRLVYDSNQFDASAIQGMLGHLKNLLESFAVGGEQPVRRISMLGPEERHRLVVERNETGTAYPREFGIPELFEQQVARRPDALAVQFEDEALTYSELNRRANRVAHHLIRRGVGPEVKVGVALERSVEMVAGILGILKAGGAYVPLDPSYPKSRLAYMMADTRTPVVLTQEHLLEDLPEYAGAVVRMDADRDRIASESEENPGVRSKADNLAYVMYTSGSTGRPKGSCIVHRSVVRLVKETNFIEVLPSDVFLQFAPISFDASTLELWAPLLNGGKLVVLPPRTLSLEELGEAIERHGVTTLWLTGALFQQMVDAHPQSFRNVRQLLAGGDSLSVPHVRRVIEDLDGERVLINGYGPTENTTFTCCHVMGPGSRFERSVPIGRPIANTRAYILDRRMDPVPAGAPGELYAGGDGLAREYLNDPVLTAKKLVPNPFGTEPGSRLYRTGDRARYLPSGSIEFLGRIDFQVKVRGYRIELGEIETALIEHPAVRDAVVIAREDQPGQKELVAYVVGETGQELSRSELRQSLGERVPDHMVPSAVVFLESLPLTPNGKVDRRALPAPTVDRQTEGAYLAPRSKLEQQIAAIWREVLDVEQVGVQDNFFDLGGHSLRLLRVHAQLVEELNLDVSITDLFQYSTIESLVARFGDAAEPEESLYAGAEARVSRRRGEGDRAVAVIGMAGRFPGAPDVETLWSNLMAGVESIRFYSEDELRKAGIPEAMLQHPSYIKAGSVLEGADSFDANLFGYTPREAELIDPQQRAFLECAWEAVERAGYDPQRYAGMIGVYGGIGVNTYLENLRSRPDIVAAAGGMQMGISSDKDYVATRVSYKLNLRGPSVTVQAACATSLIAVHEACRSLLDYQCDTALAGGVAIDVPLIRGYMHVDGGIFSPDGHCRTFDAGAQGTIAGKGVGVVVLKRLDDALRDGDEIHAVILGTAINNDGSQKVGFTAPSVQGQSEVIALAHACAGVGPEEIRYVEAHGTATALGDPIEVAALTKVFSERTAKRGFCALGSIKSNMGHLGEAAGVTGLIKTILAVKHGQVPPSLHYESPNPEIDFENSPFYVVTQAQPWETLDGAPRRAGVSSFGLGGTNAHAIVEQPPAREPSGPSRQWQLLPVSAKTPEALDEATVRLGDHLQSHSDVNLADVAFTLQEGRMQFPFRRAVICRDVAEGVLALSGGATDRVRAAHAPDQKQSVVFMFPGHGHQHVNMGRGLYESETVFRDTVEEGLGYLEDELDVDLRHHLFPAEIGSEATADLRGRPTIFQPAVFLIDYAMARQWQSWGIEPAACIGHSLGEYVAACVSGVLSYEDALRIVTLRGRLMEQTPAGAMLSIPLPEDRVRELLEDEPEIWLSAINAPSLCLVSGVPERVAELEDRLTRDGVECNRVAASHAYHSGMMDSGVRPLVNAVGKATLSAPRIPFVSNLTGEWIEESDARDPEYWGRHLREPVRFADGMGQVLRLSDHVLLEVGPGQISCSLARMHPSYEPDRFVVPSMRHPQADDVVDSEFLMGALARLWAGGVQVEWARLREGERRQRVTLPTYPFQRERYWIEPGSRAATGGRPGAAERRPDLSDWFYVPSWDRSMVPVSQSVTDVAADAPRQCVVLTNDTPFAERIVERLEQAGRAVVRIEAGDSFAGSDDRYTVRPGFGDDYRKLFSALVDSDRAPTEIVHLWNATLEPSTSDDAVARCQELGFHSLFGLAQGLEHAFVGGKIQLDVVTTGVHEVTGEESLHPEKATVLGPSRVIGVELEKLACRQIDLSVSEVRENETQAVDLLLRELLSDSGDRMVAYRRGRRMVESFAPVRLEIADGEIPERLRRKGTYLVTGGLTGIGLVLARYLAESVGANLVLTGRTELPDRAVWSDYVAVHGEQEAVSRKILAVQELESSGVEVMLPSADISDLRRMQAVVADAVERFGAIHGVIHAAGLPSEGVILEKDREQASQVLAAKVSGTRVLEQLFEDAQLDFVVLCSSLASVVGVPGLADYGGANAYLDAFARQFSSRTGTFTVAIDWNRWREVGMAVERAQRTGYRGPITGNSNLEGADLFRRILARSTEPQVLVSEIDLDAAFQVLSGTVSQPTDREEEGGTTPREPSQTSATAVAEGHARPMLANEYLAPRSETERTLADIWGQLLGIRDIGVHDNFFDLGGHSLLATQVMSRIRDTLRTEVPLRSLFHAPTIAALAEIVGPSEGAEPVETSIPRVPRQGPLPLSFAQQRLWVLDRMEPGQSVYNVYQAKRLTGDLDVPALGRALREIVRRHETLRTTFAMRDGNPVQIIHENVGFELSELDLSSIAEDRREEESRRVTNELAGRPFDLETGPLFRASLIRLDDRDFILVLALHHIISDGWSVGVLVRELGELYAAFSQGKPSSLSNLPIQYADHAKWQRDWLQGDELEAQASYWRQQLAGAPAVLDLPIDRPRPPILTFNGTYTGFDLSEEVSAALNDLGARIDATPFMSLLALFVVLLHRLTGQDDISIGTPIAGRNRTELEGLIGFFVNTLVLRVNLEGDPSFIEILGRVREVALQSFSHQDLPFERLVEEIKPDRHLNISPLFQVMFVLHNAPMEPLKLPGLSLQPAPLDSGLAKYDLTMTLSQSGDRWYGGLEYNTDLFDTSTVDRVIRAFETLAEAVVADPDRSVADLALLPDADRGVMLDDWNDTHRAFPRDRCLHQLIEDQVRSAPDAPAVAYRDRVLTYAELNAKANQLAHALGDRGVGPETLVGLCIERSPEMVVAVLGILKAGAAYVPLDPDHPPQRLAYILRETGAPVVLTREELAELFSGSEATVVHLDAGWPEIANYPEDDPAVAVDSAQLAYVIYTSGSTGRPKGVAVPHRGVVNYLDWCASFYDVASHDGSLVHSSLTFDLTVTGLFSPLITGRTVRLVPEELGLDALIDAVRTGGPYSPLKITPAHLKLLAQQISPEDLARNIRTVVVGGEALTADHIAPLRHDGIGMVVVNEYGPTETVVGSCVYRVALDESGTGPIPIGRPVANTRLYVLDRHHQPVPVGVAGELYIGGAGVTRGYLVRPDLTAERFVPDSFAEAPGERAYRTGDLARYRADGVLEFLGRVDDQVKIRGYRIELGEVEANLAESPLVEDAVVVCRADDEGDKELVAYVVGAGGREPLAGDLKRHLGETLPEYMIPTAFVVLDKIPLTPNGKVDRRALPAPSGDRQVDELYVAPRGDLENRISAIWSEILRVDQVGVRDNFFDLGGHSLRLIQVHARIVEELGFDLTVTDLFRYPTVESLVERLRGVGDNRSLQTEALSRVRSRRGAGDSDIAVIAMAGRFPGSPDVETLWANLRDGVESIRFFSRDELREAGISEALLDNPDYVRAQAVLDGADRFDARFFGFTPREAETIDPQQRVFLECAWESLERAGYDPARHAGLIGVYAGTSMNTYLTNLRSHPEVFASVGEFQVIINNDKDFLPTRVSYKLNLRGPAVNLQTACSTSLVAVHEACRSLIEHRCDLALAGGVSVTVPMVSGYLYQEGGIASPDGHCRPFDARAGGTVGGNAVGIVVLKRLDEALRDGDEVHAVIRGTATNNDGSQKVGFTAPSVEGQAEVIAMAQAEAGVDPESVTYVEAHGTATALGDPVEVAALTRVFGERSKKRAFCGLGSLKSNMGHLDAAAGVAGLIKTVLALEHRQLPPSLHFEQPNPEIDSADSPFYVVRALRDWETASGAPRRAGVSSFGLGGTNAHAVLQEAPAIEPSGRSRELQVLVLSAKDPTALDTARTNLAAWLREHDDVNLADVAFTLQVGRQEFQYRHAVACRSVADAVEALEGGAAGKSWTSQAPEGKPPVVFMFPGHGHQHINMGRGLYESETVFRDTVDEGLGYLRDDLEVDLESYLFPADVGSDVSAALRGRPTIFQPAVFLIDYAMAKLWQSWGIEPAACIGHSLGEYVAACVSGVLTYEDALRIVTLRGRLMERTPPGSMLSIPLPEDRVRELLANEQEIWLSAVNAPSLCLVSGAPDSVAAFEERLTREGVECNRVAAAHAYHSGMMESGVEQLVDAVRKSKLHRPRIPFVSNLTGDWIKESEARDPEYWGQHLREPVRFAEGMERILGMANHVLLEVGPGQIINSLARMHPGCGPDRLVVPSMRHPQADDLGDTTFLMGALARLWTGGGEVDWLRFHEGNRRRRLTLPTYPFQRERYWVERRLPEPRRVRASLDDWFYVPAWRRVAAPDVAANRVAEQDGECCLVFAEDSDFSRRIVKGLEEAGRPVTVVEAGDAYGRNGERHVLVPGSREDYVRLMTALVEEKRVPRQIVHLWGMGPHPDRLDDGVAERCLDRGFFSLLHVVQALEDANTTDPVSLDVVTSGVEEIQGGESLCPERAAVIGPCRIIGSEFPNVRCRHVDLATEEMVGDGSRLVAQVLTELLAESHDSRVAYRRGGRWVESFTRLPLRPLENEYPTRLRPGGTYLITGGLGGIGLELAKYLARSVQANLVLTARTQLPDRTAWSDHVAEHGEDDPVSRKIRAIEMVESEGAQVLVCQADVTDLDDMRAVVSEATERFGGIHGVVHAAGVPAGGVILLKEREAAQQVLAPKITGARVLERLFGDADLDFLVLCSSLSGILSEPGQVDHCAANAYLDVFARHYAARTGTYTVAIDWNRWREVGQAVDAARDLRGYTGPLDGASNREGIEVFRRVLNDSVAPQVVISHNDLWAELAASSSGLPPQSEARAEAAVEESAEDTPVAYSRPRLATEFTAPRTDTETSVAEIWQELFGIDRVGINDDFYDLGGHSLLATRLLNRVRSAFDVTVSLADVFSSPTVSELALIIERKLLAEIEQLSEEEAARLVELDSGDR